MLSPTLLPETRGHPARGAPERGSFLARGHLTQGLQLLWGLWDDLSPQ